ncbi:MAG: DUF4129 domain-containing protein [Armatimonadota bacterium]|nr:DUF4129 domain-containing protein [Armatimonadota bacterium]MDR7451046.1 DUF4129 domain-containing protein [Armatimonadota bacterium]MDR7465933.1 DUF4129 domain-containing protein [Armatimonadota bacterium]MDR7493998.1 DUF4129 domain-containing protein [Armatimonadota bacterium]MDR7498448.1 DUF4129 domain-containing protein [Armatimonadota bacterium]
MTVLLRELLALGLVVIEFCWLYPWVLLATGGFYGPASAPLLPPGAALLLLAGGFVAVRLVSGRPWALATVRAVVVGTGLVFGLGAVKMAHYPAAPVYDLRWVATLLQAAHDALPVILPPVMGALLATLLWWRGIVLGEREFTHFEVERAFRRGVGWTVTFVILFVIYGDARGFVPAASAPGYLLGFFSCGLVLLAVTRLLEIWRENQAEAAQALAANRHWLLLLVGVVGMILSGAALLSGLLNVRFRPVVLSWLRPLAPVVEVLFLTLFAVALVVAKVIIFVLSRLPWRPVRFDPQGTLQQPLSALLRELPPRVVSGARWGVVFLVIVALIALVAVAIVRARRRPRRADEDERESVWDARAVLAGMGRAWRSLWERRHAVAGEADHPAVGALRTIYRELLRIGRGLGTPRNPAETPYEYRPRLRAALPSTATEIAFLTEAYVRARYSPSLPSDQEVEEARDALERVRNASSISGGGEE